MRFIIYDSKAIDYSVFNGTPHMLLPVITDERKAAGAVLWLNTEIQRRIKTFFDAGTKDLAGYNGKAAPFMHAEVNLNNSLLDSRYRNLPVKQAGTVDQILNENYDQEDYLIYDMVGFRRVKCVKCGSILPEKDILKLVKCSTGICQKCGE